MMSTSIAWAKVVDTFTAVAASHAMIILAFVIILDNLIIIKCFIISNETSRIAEPRKKFGCRVGSR